MGRLIKITRFAMMASICLGFGLTGMGCATGEVARHHRADPIVEPAGPGAVFPTIDAAAVDGLAYSHRRGIALDGGTSALGGTVYRVARGYSYEAPHGEPQSDPDRVRLTLSGRDVAHFATYPSGSSSENRMNEIHSDHDRRNVDERDPLHRPAFILTPSLEVKSYVGESSRFVASIVAARTKVASSH